MFQRRVCVSVKIMHRFLDEKGDVTTWSLSYSCRNSNALKRQDVLDLAVQLVGRNYRVDLRNPDKLLIVEVVKVSF